MTQSQYYIQNEVRRSVASREAGLNEIPVTIYEPGRLPVTTTLKLDQLYSPKLEILSDPRFQRIQPPIHIPIEVEPLGFPGQMATIPVRHVRLLEW